MIHVKRPADPLDLAAIWKARGKSIVPFRAHASLQAQALGGPSYAVYAAGDELLALAGLYPRLDAAVLWFFAGPASGRALPALFVAARRELRIQRHLHPRIIAEIEIDNVAGERLARALGFVPERVPDNANFCVWVLRGGCNGKNGQRSIRRRRRRRGDAPGAGGAAGQDRRGGSAGRRAGERAAQAVHQPGRVASVRRGLRPGLAAGGVID